MQGTELYGDLIASLASWTRRRVARLSPEELAWQPDADANNIGVTVWHYSRWLDVAARVLREKPRDEELWLTRGWAERTGYNPHGRGFQGLGVLTGYTLQEVAAVPRLTAEELLTYLDQVCETLRTYVLSLPSLDPLLQPISDDSVRLPIQQDAPTKHQLLRTILMGSCGHVGEIEALSAMMKRANATSLIK